MEDFIAHNSRWRVALIFVGAIGFWALGMWMVGAFGEVPSSRRHSAGFFMTIGWLCILFFGLCGLATVKKFFNHGPQLQVGPAGIRWRPRSDDLIPWSEIIDVTTWSYKGQKTIVLHLSNADRFPGRGLTAKLAAANRTLTGGHISISLTGTDRSYGEAMAAIAHFRNATVCPHQ